MCCHATNSGGANTYRIVIMTVHLTPQHIVFMRYCVVCIACSWEAAQRSDCLKDERAMCEKKGELVHVCILR